MAELVIRLPDVGEGIAEAEVVEWHVGVGDRVREDAVLAAVMTDKATVEIPSPVEGEVLWLGAEVGDKIPVGSPLIRLQVAGEGEAREPDAREVKPAASPQPESPEPAAAAPAALPRAAARAVPERRPDRPSVDEREPPASATSARWPVPRAEGQKPIASPAVRLRAREAGVDLRQVHGSGPAGRITHEDLERFLAGGDRVTAAPHLVANTAVEDIKVVGLRRRIGEQMALAKSRIPHITYVEEIDVSALEDLRAALNAQKRREIRLTLLPFLMRAMVKAIAGQPRMNALYDDNAGVIHQHGGVHIGIAAQTPGGLVVPVVRHAEARDLWGCAAEVNRLAEAARAGTATREELRGSTITITSLGAMGGIVTTPVINYPEVAIIGVNKIMVRPVWNGSTFIPRKMMNLSSSFDHRVVDGWDAAAFVQRIKSLLETPSLIFVEG
jgi:2-oxoisovalerate dehydrogenase E2 component (dihydrolipoyl transacylase)